MSLFVCFIMRKRKWEDPCGMGDREHQEEAEGRENIIKEKTRIK